MTYQIRVTLTYTQPPIWRRLRVPARTSLARLHKALQLAMGWGDYHLYLFHVGGKDYGVPDPDWDDVLDSRKMTLDKVFDGGRKSFIYEYDMGDSWEHEIRLLRTVDEDGPFECVAGARACPPEDCGGTPGYYELLRKLSDPDNPEHDDIIEWVGGEFDPSVFDIAAVNRALKRMR